MARKLFRIGAKWINLAFVKQIEVWSPLTWSSDPDEASERLCVHLLVNDSVTVTEQEAQNNGFADISALRDALIEALEKYDG